MLQREHSIGSPISRTNNHSPKDSFNNACFGFKAQVAIQEGAHARSSHLRRDLNLVSLVRRPSHHSSFDFRFVFGFAARGCGFMAIIARTVASMRLAISSSL